MSSTLSFTPTPGETTLVNQIFTRNDPQKFGVITGDVAVKIFGGANLSSSVLGEIWAIADADNNGFLTRKGVSVAVRLMGWAQKGEAITEDLINKPGPLPALDGYSSSAGGSQSHSPAAPKSPPPRSPVPPLTPQDKAKFHRLFVSCGPANGLLSGDKARDVFVKSKLPVDKLSSIWNLSDTQSRGSLDATDFCIAMYLIQLSMSGQLSFIPTSLPPGLYDQAKVDGVASHSTGATIGSRPLSPNMTGTFNRVSTIQPQYSGPPVQQQYTGQTLQPQYTGSGMKTAPAIPPRPAPASANIPPFPGIAQQQQQSWDVTPTEKANSDKFYDTLDAQKRGFIEGDVAVPFMLQSKLSEDVLAQIWDLADLNNDGRLTRDGFAVAMHLIQSKLAGKDIPATLPTSLIPPSMRSAATNGITAGSPFAPPQPQSELRDLIWDETPPPSATQPQQHQAPVPPQQTGPFAPQMTGGSPFGGPSQFQPPQMQQQHQFAPPPPQDPFGGQAAKDLLGDDDDVATPSPPIHDHSVEIGNVQNQLDSTNRSLENTKTDRATIEATIATQAAQLSALQTQLSSAKAAYETETRLLSALRERHNGQSADIGKTREELIRAESDLSAVRVEKAEIEQTVLRDKEEIRDLQRRMTETGSTIEQMKGEIEKAKKDAKHQKGLLAIAKKQLATRDAERAKVAKELDGAKKEAEEVTKEREAVDEELAKEPEATIPASALANGNGLERMSSPDSLSFAAAQPLPGTPGSPMSMISPMHTGKSNNPFDRLAQGESRSGSPFQPFGNSPSPGTPGQQTPAAAAAEAAVDSSHDDPFGFNEPFTPTVTESQEASFAAEQGTPDVNGETPSATPKIAGPDFTQSDRPLSSVTSESDDLFTTPPTTAIATQMTGEHPPTGFSALPPPGISTDIAELSSKTPEPIATADKGKQKEEGDILGETDLTSHVKDLEVDESDSSDDSDDEVPLGTLANKTSAGSPEPQAPTTNGFEAPAAPAVPAFSFDDAFAEPATTIAPSALPAESNKAEPLSAQTSGLAGLGQALGSASASPASPFPQVSSPLGDSTTVSAGVNDFDEAMGKIPTTANSGTDQKPEFSFDSAFEDNFDFGSAGASVGAIADGASSNPFPPAPGATSTSSPFPPVGSSPFPPAPSATTNGNATSPFQSTAPKNDGFDSLFGTSSPPAPAPASAQHSATASSFDDAFGMGSVTSVPSQISTQAPTHSGQPSASADSHGISFDDAFGGMGGTKALALDNAFGSTSSAGSALPNQTSSQGHAGQGVPQSPTQSTSTPFPASPPLSASVSSKHGNPKRSMSPPPRSQSPVARISSPKQRPSTAGSQKDGSEKSIPTRHSKISIRLPFGKKKKTLPEASHPPPPPSSLSHHLMPVADESAVAPGGTATPAVEDDVEPVKQLCGMGFSRTQAVSALEANAYDFQKALNSLLGS